MAIEFELHEEGNHLVLHYIPDDSESDWVKNKLEEDGCVEITKTFSFEKGDLLSSGEPFSGSIKFFIATLEGDFFRFKQDMLGIHFDVFFHKGIKLERKFFSSYRDIKIFPRVNALRPITRRLYIGGEEDPRSKSDDAWLTERDFAKVLRQFPNSTELNRYAAARVSVVWGRFFDFESDASTDYQAYMNKKPSVKGVDLQKKFLESDLDKYKEIRDKLKGMLAGEEAYSEAQWQKEIVQIFRLLFPKYIYALEGVQIPDGKKVDFLLVDSAGHIDIVEIKKPFNQCLVTCSPSYRGNFTPLRDLSGAIMQVEKYIFRLNRGGEAEEKRLTKKLAESGRIPLENFSLKIVNPSGFIIMGRSNSLAPEQKADFEVIKRKYKNIVDIITYDDLLQRLDFTIAHLENSKKQTGEATP